MRGARRIEVILAGGGIERIEVIDDGSGIPQSELALAIERHATSKLGDETLVRIATLGFRGEALPSIGAAARLTLVSRPAGQDSGYRITVAGGEVGEVAPAASPFGTRAIVEDLFYATPARRKFLRSPRAEADAAERAVWRLALSAPQVAFRLVSDMRVMFDVPAQGEPGRVAALFGRETAASLLVLEAQRDGVMLSGLAGPASLSRATTMLQSFVVNGRPVQDPLLRMALRLAYRDVIASGRHPVAALRLDLAPEALDVNVHPAKTELRFADANGIRSLVIGAIGRLLARPVTVAGAPDVAMRSAEVTPAAAPWREMAQPNPAPGFMPSGFDQPALHLRPSPAARGFAEAELALLAPPAARRIQLDVAEQAHPLGAPVAQILDTYVLAVAADGALVIVDQHAAHERLTEERLKAEFQAGAVKAQPLLLPVVVDLAPIDAARLLGEAETLKLLGLEIEAFGAGAILVRAVPAALKEGDPSAMVRDLAEELAESEAPLALEARLDAGTGAAGLPSFHPGWQAAGSGRDVGLAARDGGDAACRHVQPWPADLFEADESRAGEDVWAAGDVAGLPDFSVTKRPPGANDGD